MSASNDPTPRLFLLAGGRGTDPKAATRVVSRVLDSAGGGRSVAYIGAANGDDQRFFGWIGEMLRQGGARKIDLVPLVADTADTRAARRMLENADLVFVSGGDVEAGMEVLRKRRLVTFLRELYASGKHFCGVSAGSIMLAAEWVRWRDPDDDSSAQRFDCLNIAPLRCDAHGEEEGWVELQALLRLCPVGTLGYGIRSGAALALDADGRPTTVAGTVDCFVSTENGVVSAFRERMVKS